MQIIGFLVLCGFFYRLAKPVKHTYPLAAAFDKRHLGAVNGSRVLIALAAAAAASLLLVALAVIAALAKHHLSGF
ncbi:hypothetical protein [Neisseria yangbaofengii]|uniref:hypothetical protein n=1 Tax=Neisseria yangbaofengii TaxID=2709396 RepID=UPI0013EC1419|nr:hypothetical protein [Neisseria yangbaofengii]